jgi:hypothetical protein
VSVPELAVE